MHMAVLGSGSWGTALAHLMADKGIKVIVLARDPDIAACINTEHTNPHYLPKFALSKQLVATTNPEQALSNAEVCLLAVPCQFLREALTRVAPYIPARAIPVCVSKGIETNSLSFMSQIVAEILPQQAKRYAILSGPSFAHEVVQGRLTAVVLGCAQATLGEWLRVFFSTSRFRVYSSTDVTGVECGGAMKNVMAIAAGLCNGLELGANAHAALITRGIAEISRLGTILGGRATTFMGLSGLGDLILTCSGNASRNRQVGLRLAAGEKMQNITANMRQVAEGIKTTEATCALAQKAQVEMPIANSVKRLLAEDLPPVSLVEELMARALREE